MEITDETYAEVFGLYELANDGTVLYSRPRPVDGLHAGEQRTIGQDFSETFFHVRILKIFAGTSNDLFLGDRSVDSFEFHCMFEREIVRTKVFMTRAHESDYDHAGEIVIMDIRRAV